MDFTQYAILCLVLLYFRFKEIASLLLSEGHASPNQFDSKQFRSVHEWSQLGENQRYSEAYSQLDSYLKMQGKVFRVETEGTLPDMDDKSRKEKSRSKRVTWHEPPENAKGKDVDKTDRYLPYIKDEYQEHLLHHKGPKKSKTKGKLKEKQVHLPSVFQTLPEPLEEVEEKSNMTQYVDDSQPNLHELLTMLSEQDSSAYRKPYAEKKSRSKHKKYASVAFVFSTIQNGIIQQRRIRLQDEIAKRTKDLKRRQTDIILAVVSTTKAKHQMFGKPKVHSTGSLPSVSQPFPK